MDDHPADGLRLLQPDVFEGLPAVGRLVHASTERRALAVVRLSGADVDDIGVRGRHLDVADGRHRVFVENRCPRRAVVDRFPNAAGGVTDVHHRRIAFINGNVIDTSAHDCRANRPPHESLEHRVVRLVDGGKRCDRFLTLGLPGEHALAPADRQYREASPYEHPRTHVSSSLHVSPLLSRLRTSPAGQDCGLRLWLTIAGLRPRTRKRIVGEFTTN